MRQLRHRHAATTDQPRIRDGMMGRPERPRPDECRAVAREADDAVDVYGLDGFGPGHRRRDGGGVSSEWEGAAGHTITLCQRKSVDVGYHQFQGRLWGEAKVAKRVQGGGVEFVSNVYLENGHQVIQCNIRDMTARLQAEAQVQRQREALFQSEKLATMGQLLAGVAHELNNPLSVVMGQAALLQHAIRDTRQAEQAAKIAQAVERCARIVQNFLALARQQPPERHSVDVNQVVRKGGTKR